MIEYINFFVLGILWQSADLHGTWRCHYDETLWRDPEMESLSPGFLESINYYGWGFTLKSDGTGKYVSIGDKWKMAEDEEFIFSRQDSVLSLGYSRYIIEKLEADTLVIRTKKKNQISFIKRYFFHRE